MRFDDPHSFARPWETSVQHLALDLEVDFGQRQLTGTATLELKRSDGASELVLDTWGLAIDQVQGNDGKALDFAFGEDQGILGRPLVISLAPSTQSVSLSYRTSPNATALQWLEPAQTANGNHPLLFTQSQAILARTWVPLQDSPAVRFTYEAQVRVPTGMIALMSARNPRRRNGDGKYSFKMTQPIPSYLMALAVGNLEFQSLGPRTGVYAEPETIDAASWELAGTESMIAAAENLYGAYRWGRYDLLILPPSFPFGGMENPRLTFATPTILAGDRSLVSLVAHELAHSWSGNLVTNASWNDFWLNEGFTTYFEHRIMEALYGTDHAEMLALISRQELDHEIETLGASSPDTHLQLSLAGRDPDDGMNLIAYDKGFFFLRMLEEAVGRSAWDDFVRRYFDEFAFQSMSTERFLDYLETTLLAPAGTSRERLHVDDWVFGPGLPADAPRPSSPALARVEQEIQRLLAGTPAAELATEGWETQRKLHFLRNLPGALKERQLADIDKTFGFTETGNCEILAAWLLLTIRHAYQPADAALERFLMSQGRRKFLKPLYDELARTEAGCKRAVEIFERAKPGYHPVAAHTIEALLR